MIFRRQSTIFLRKHVFIILKFIRQGTKPISPFKWVKKNMEYFSGELDIDYDIISKKIMMVC